MHTDQDLFNSKEFKELPDLLPVLPLRDEVVFPGILVPLYVGREKSLRAIDFATNSTDSQILLVAQKDAAIEDPKLDDIYKVGVIGNIIQILKLTDGTLKLLVESHQKVKVNKYIDNEGTFFCEYTVIEDQLDSDDVEVEALARSVKNDFEYFSKFTRRSNPNLHSNILATQNHLKLLDLVCYHLPNLVEEKQRLLEIEDQKVRFLEILTYLQKEISLIDAEHKIKARVKKQMEKTQREYYLNEQMKAIQQELGEVDDVRNDIKLLEQQIENTPLSKEAREKLTGEIKKLKMMNAMSAEASVIRNYIELILSLPWGKFTKNKIDLNKAEKTLDSDHYGLEKVKERILEYLAVQKRTNSLKSPIICLVGPPGVGKTSLAKSIAEATNRNYVRISLGGVRDEAEIRGHRKTYVGAMPGKVINSIKKVKSANPLILLDEIDKMGMDFRGDPTSALLEVLDPAQNATFVDHYVEVEFDLSKVMFVATANSTNLPRPLLDRMEIIRLSGYTEIEKLEIAQLHLIPKLLKDHGIKKDEVTITEDAVLELIRSYTREAGVRNLERELAKAIRKSLRKIMTSDIKSIVISKDNIEDFAGVKKFLSTEAGKESRVGLTNGLAYTEAGGELLYIEAVKIPGKGNVKVTGKLGEVMQESAQAAVSYVKSKAKEFGILPSIYQNYDVHIHVPEGATPKDGPSACIALATTIVSLFTNIPVRKDVAMTGEITLSGRVLAIGGLKEKLLAATRSGITTAIIPEENKKDLAEIPDVIKNALDIIPVSHLNDVLEVALTKKIVPIADDHPEIIAINNPKLITSDNKFNDRDEVKRH